MAAIKHTPGPWVVSKAGFNVERTDMAVTIARTQPSAFAKADAHLIAAAPELLAALKLLLPLAQTFEKQASGGTGGRRGGPVFQKARAAIAKAEGKDNG